MAQVKALEPEYKYPKAVCTDEERQIAIEVRRFVDGEVMPRRQDLEGGWSRDEERARETLHMLYARCHQLGYTKISFSERVGGLGLSPVGIGIVFEELARGDVGLSLMVSKPAWVAAALIGTRRFDLMEELAPYFTGRDPWTVAVCITEPGGGANIEDPALEFKTLRTTIRREGDEWVINGHKIWPGHAGPPERYRSKWLKGHAGYLTIVTEDPKRGKDAVGLVYVPADAEGLSFSAPIKKCGFCWTDENAEIWYENVRVPLRYRLDTKPGQAAKVIEGYIIAIGRLQSSAFLLGAAEACLEAVLEWTGNREIAGKPVRERSFAAMILGEMIRAVDAARLYYLTTLREFEVARVPPWNPLLRARFSAVRSFAADAAEFVINKAMELMGAYGYAYEYNIEKYYRDFKMVKLWLGGPQRDRLDIAQGVYGPFRWGGQEEWEKTP